jgi:uncharacterized protein YbjT (DUF2867 family)
MGSPKQSRKVTIVGASGNVGKPTVSALLAAGHKVSVLTRPSSTATYPPSVTVHKGDYNDEAFVVSALKGQDILILVPAYTVAEIQYPLIRAAAKAGVPYVLPCEFGSDPTHVKMNTELDMMNAKRPFRTLIEELGVSSWIGVINNPWVEFSIRLGLYGIDLTKRTAAFYDDGDVKVNITTLTRVGESLAALFSLPDEELKKYRNQFVYLSSFYVSQRDILASAIRATGTSEKDWKITRLSTDEVLEASRKPDADTLAMMMSLFAVVFKDGYGGDYNHKVLDLGLEQEDLDALMKKLAKELGA